MSSLQSGRTGWAGLARRGGNSARKKRRRRRSWRQEPQQASYGGRRIVMGAFPRNIPCFFASRWQTPALFALDIPETVETCRHSRFVSWQKPRAKKERWCRPSSPHPPPQVPRTGASLFELRGNHTIRGQLVDDITRLYTKGTLVVSHCIQACQACPGMYAPLSGTE